MISISIRNLEPIRAYLKKLGLGYRVAGLRGATNYLIGNDSHGLRHYVNYKYVSRQSAYGRTFFSDKQRRWFWAAVANGEIAFPIHYQRTGAIKDGWKIADSGSQMRIVNNAPGVNWVFGANQARQPAKVGWRKASDIIQTNMKGMIRAAQLEVNKLIRSAR